MAVILRAEQTSPPDCGSPRATECLFLGTSLSHPEEHCHARPGRHPHLHRGGRDGRPQPGRASAGHIQVDDQPAAGAAGGRAWHEAAEPDDTRHQPHGRRPDYKQRGERILADLEQAGEAAAQHSGEVTGRLRLSAPLSFGTTHVAPLVAELAVRHPRLVIETAYSDRIVDLIGDRFDAAIRIGMLKDSTLVARRIAAVRIVVVASPAYLQRVGAPATPEDLNAPRMPDLLAPAGTRPMALPRRPADGDGVSARPLFFR